jgi:hypothetical protein
MARSGVLSYHARHIVADLLSGHHIVVALIVIAVILVALVGPVIGENLMNSVTAGAARVAPRVFVIGLAVLLLGLVTRLGILEAGGACLIGAVLLGAILRDY